MRTCGNCLTYRFGKCKNRRAATYGMIFPANSESCPMHRNRIPAGDKVTSGVEYLGTSVYKAIRIAHALYTYEKSFKPKTDREYWDF